MTLILETFVDLKQNYYPMILPVGVNSFVSYHNDSVISVRGNLPRWARERLFKVAFSIWL